MDNKLTDQTVTINDLKAEVQAFCEARDWDQFHNAKDLAIGISTEANELLDIFRFKSVEQMEGMFRHKETREHIGEELADAFFFVLRFAQMNQMDLTQCLMNKLEKNNKKYPVDKVFGKNMKYSEIEGL